MHDDPSGATITPLCGTKIRRMGSVGSGLAKGPVFRPVRVRGIFPNQECRCPLFRSHATGVI